MRVPPPDLEPDELRILVARRWGLDVQGLAYAPVGFGAHHWIASDGTASGWWVSAHEVGSTGLAGLTTAMATASALQRAGLEFVLAPVPTLEGGLVVPLGQRLAVEVQPFVPDALEADGSAVAPLLVRLHTATPAAAELAGRDDLTLDARSDLESALTDSDVAWTGGPFTEPARSLLAAAAPAVRAALQRYDALVPSVATEPVVVTHGEPKPDNLLRTLEGGHLLIDWDTALLAPAARDLWWLDRAALAAYEARTGTPTPAAGLELYRLRWALTDLGQFLRALRAPHVDDADTRIAFAAVGTILQGGRFSA